MKILILEDSSIKRSAEKKVTIKQVRAQFPGQTHLYWFPWQWQ